MEIIFIIITLFLSFILVLSSIPSILRVARAKKLYEPFDKRRIHTRNIPALGGIAIFVGFVISVIIGTYGYSFDGLKYIIASVILVFFIGLKDDLLIVSTRLKTYVQLFAAIMLITLGDINITDLHGILRIEEINYVSSFLLSLFLILAIVNAFNLIDGIDGLASGLGMLAAVVFGIWFYLAGHFHFSIISFALFGSLMGFFLYNVFGQQNKLFMGDSGSLVLGLIISILVIKFNEFNIIQNVPFAIKASPGVSFAVIIVPLIDTLRVIIIRILHKKSPFTADNNHIHHRMLVLFPNHLTVTVIIFTVNAFLIGIALLFNKISFNVTLQFLSLFILGSIFSYIPSLLLNRKHRIIPEFVSMNSRLHYKEVGLTVVGQQNYLEGNANVQDLTHHKRTIQLRSKKLEVIKKEIEK